MGNDSKRQISCGSLGVRNAKSRGSAGKLDGSGRTIACLIWYEMTETVDWFPKSLPPPFCKENRTIGCRKRGLLDICHSIVSALPYGVITQLCLWPGTMILLNSRKTQVCLIKFFCSIDMLFCSGLHSLLKWSLGIAHQSCRWLHVFQRVRFCFCAGHTHTTTTPTKHTRSHTTNAHTNTCTYVY